MNGEYMQSLKNKKVIVTGAAMGIGLATAKRLAKEGCEVTVWDINETALAEATRQLSVFGNKVHAYVCDVTDKKRVMDLVQKAEQDMGRIDILINNAGILYGGRFIDRPVEDWERLTHVNLLSMYYTIHAVLPAMFSRNEGHIVNMSSAGGLIGAANLATYCATKWAILGLTESLRLEAIGSGKKNVKFSSIHPMYINQGMAAGAELNWFGRLMVPNIKSHESIAMDIVEKALKRQRQVVKRPKIIHFLYLLRGILPPSWVTHYFRLIGLCSSMKDWRGHS